MKNQFAFLQDVAEAQDRSLARSTNVAREIERLPSQAAVLFTVGSRRRAIWVAAGAAATLAAITVAYVTTQNRPLTFSVADERRTGELGTTLAAPQTQPVALDFSDGSKLKLAAGGQARVTELDMNGAVVRLERGHADVSVVPRHGANWRVDAGPFHVFVKGTEFSLDWDPNSERLAFRLLKGAVVIDGGCLERAHALTAGESLYTSCSDLKPAAAAPSESAQQAPVPEPSGLPVSQLPVAPSGGSPPPSREVDASTWRQLAAKQRFREALEAVEKSGFEQELERANADDLLLLGDVGRLAGNPRRALQAYLTARKRHPAASRSAFAIGLVQFDQRRSYGEAAQWFSTYLREEPNGPLAEQATGRLMEAADKAGDRATARTTAEHYLAEHPRGAYIGLARRLTANE